MAEAAAAGRGLPAQASHEGAHTLKAGAIGLLSSTVIGVASTALDHPITPGDEQTTTL